MKLNPESTESTSSSRRKFLAGATAAMAAAMAARPAAAETPRDWTGVIPTRYPDPDIVSLDPRFDKLKLGNTPIQRIYHSPDMLWAEGPAWNGVGRYLLWSDIPNNVQLRWLEEDGHVTPQFRNPSGNSNGNTFDYEGRQISCQHGPRKVVRYEHNGTVTVLAEEFEGKSLNAPNDAVVHPEDGAIWFTDPGYGGLMNYEGTRATTGSVQPYQKEAVYRIDAKDGKITKLTDEIFKPNGLCFSPDYKKLYVADTGASHYPDAPKNIKVWDIEGTTLKNGREFASMNLDIEGEVKAGFADGIRADEYGNIWSSAGWVGEGYDGVHIFGVEDGARIGQILLPEICSNVCFGGSKRNRLFMTASTSVYAMYTETKGAHIS
ncbi:MAG: SMP-30/gluconolactonase/LRE family protein [Akkermansiaceae bacterium]|jgi:gluconolactonase